MWQWNGLLNIHVRHQLGDNILKERESILLGAVCSLNQGPILVPEDRDLGIQRVKVGAAPFTTLPNNPLKWFLPHGPATLSSAWFPREECFHQEIKRRHRGTGSWDCHLATLGFSWHWANRWRKSLLYWLGGWIPITNKFIVILKSVQVGFLSFVTKVYHRSSISTPLQISFYSVSLGCSIVGPQESLWNFFFFSQWKSPFLTLKGMWGDSTPRTKQQRRKPNFWLSFKTWKMRKMWQFHK